MSSNGAIQQGMLFLKGKEGFETESTGCEVVAFDHLSRYITKHKFFHCKEEAIAVGLLRLCNFHLHCTMKALCLVCCHQGQSCVDG